MPLNNCSLLFRSESYWLRSHESCYLVIFPKVQRILYTIHFKCILEFSFITQHSKKGESELIKIKITVYCSSLSRCHYSFLNAVIPLYMNFLLQTDAKKMLTGVLGEVTQRLIRTFSSMHSATEPWVMSKGSWIMEREKTWTYRRSQRKWRSGGACRWLSGCRFPSEKGPQNKREQARLENRS